MGLAPDDLEHLSKRLSGMDEEVSGFVPFITFFCGLGVTFGLEPQEMAVS